MRFDIGEPLPLGVRPPLRWRDPGAAFEGSVDHPVEMLERFEPMDVLSGEAELVDQDGTLLTIRCDDPRVVESNEYPAGYRGIYCVVHGRGAAGR